MVFWMCLVSIGGIIKPHFECLLPLSSAARAQFGYVPATEVVQFRPLQRYGMFSAVKRLRWSGAYLRRRMCYSLYMLHPSRRHTYTTSVCGVRSCSTKALI